MVEEKTSQSVQSEIPVKIDLEMAVGETVIRYIVLPSGEKGKIEVTKLADPIEYGANLRAIRWHSQKANNGTYFVNAYVVIGYAGFNINVRSGNITRAYDGQYFFAGMDASASLALEGREQATYYLNFSVPTPWVTAASWNGYVRASIEGSQLVTYIQ